jgi:hypothetical protein
MAVSDSAVRRTRSPYSHPWLARLLFALDERLRRRLAVFEYSRNPSCVFRADIARAPRPVTLRDGTRVDPGKRIARLHFWNEHIPPVPQNGPTIAWARQMQQAMATSLRELARYLGSRPDLGDVTAICAVAPSATDMQRQQLARIMARYGFEAIAEPAHLPIGERVHRFGENILISLIVLAQNAAALRLDTLDRVRLPIYLSRRRLQEKFSNSGQPASGIVEAS